MATSANIVTLSHHQQGLRKMRDAFLDDWAECTLSTSCSNGCCSAKYSRDGKLRCTPFVGGFHSDVCVVSSSVTQETTVMASATSENGFCGSGSRGNGICADGSCCSELGWCGTTAEHCNSDSVDETASSALNGTCGNGLIGNGICRDGSCCSKFGWCGPTEDYCSNASSAPVPSLAPATMQGDVVNGTVSTTPSPTATNTSLSPEKSHKARTIVLALVAVVVVLVLVSFLWKLVKGGLCDSKNGDSEKPAEPNGPSLKFWNCNRTAASVDSSPEANKEPNYPDDIVVETLEDPSIADQSLYTSPSYIWRPDQSSEYPLRYPASLASLMGGSMAGFSVSGVSWASAKTEESTASSTDVQQDSIILGLEELDQTLMPADC